MKVRRLIVNSFRGIDDLTRDFNEMGSTVLIGINGVGKSSILDGLAILLSQFIGRIQISPNFIRSLSEQDITYGSRGTRELIMQFKLL
jgi:predicted ATP-dependent endonuclease of OLD family